MITLKPLKREIRVPGITAPVVLTITESGMEMNVKGYKTRLFTRWDKVVTDGMFVPHDAPAKYHVNPMALLRDQAKDWKTKHDKQTLHTLQSPDPRETAAGNA